MKKLLLLLLLPISLYSQNYSIASKDTIYTKSGCYLTEVNSTDAGVINTSTIKELIDSKFAIIIKKNTTLYSIAIGHQINTKYYDAYVVTYKNKLYYINTLVVLNANILHKKLYNDINEKILQDSIYTENVKKNILLNELPATNKPIIKQKDIVDLKYDRNNIITGPRGGRFYINSHGNKTYIKR